MLVPGLTWFPSGSNRGLRFFRPARFQLHQGTRWSAGRDPTDLAPVLHDVGARHARLHDRRVAPLRAAGSLVQGAEDGGHDPQPVPRPNGVRSRAAPRAVHLPGGAHRAPARRLVLRRPPHVAVAGRSPCVRSSWWVPMVPPPGVEPGRPRGHAGLSRARLPVPSRGRGAGCRDRTCVLRLRGERTATVLTRRVRTHPKAPGACGLPVLTVRRGPGS